MTASGRPGDHLEGALCSPPDGLVLVGPSPALQHWDTVVQQVAAAARGLGQRCEGPQGVDTHGPLPAAHQGQESREGPRQHSLELTWRGERREVRKRRGV